jgi:hypothetical protein
MAKGDNFKGAKPANSGRKKGTPNKTSAELGMAYGGLMEKAVERVLKIANETEDPALAIKATDICLPYFYAKLSGVQQQQPSNDQPTEITVRFVTPPTEPDAD